MRSRHTYRYSIPVLLACAALGVACEPESSTPQPAPIEAPETGALAVGGDRDHAQLRIVDGPAAIRAELGSTGAIALAAPTEPFVRAGLRWDSTGDAALEYRVSRAGEWTAWTPVEVTWNESVAFNGALELAAAADALEVRPGASAAADAELGFVYIETYADYLEPEPVPVDTRGAADDRYVTAEYALAPPNWVVPRAEWGARSTGTCGSAHTPTYLTVHHTVGPTVDSMTPAARMRQIQNYHIDSNGWCDIGYHFVVAADGTIYQGRASHDRSGAHVGGHNSNNVGISFMGSFHIDQVPQAMIDGTGPLFAWFRDNYAIPLTRGQRVFGHQEWSGQSTACPGQFLLPRIEEIIAVAEGGPTDEDFDIDVGWADIPGQARDLVSGGSSNGIFDAIVGQEVVGWVVVQNGADRPATDDVILGYWLESPFWEPVSYTIEVSNDGSTWTASGENGRADNPDPSAPPASGNVHIGSLAPGQWARVLITARASRYSIGKADHPDLRAWVKHIGSYYGEQDGWNDEVEVNQAGKVLQDYAQADIFAPDEWAFDGGAGDDVEGWAIASDVSDLAVNTNDTALAMKADGPDPNVVSPAWTAIDAETDTTLVIRARQHGGLREAQVFWAHDGEGFAEERSLTFQTAGDGEYELFELDMTGQTGWNGTITQLRLDPWAGGPYEAAAAWFDIDYIVVAAGEMPLVDDDGDGSIADVDCDDTNDAIYPGAPELCDGEDNDCDGATDEGCDADDPGDNEDMSMGTSTGGTSTLPDATTGIGPIDDVTIGGDGGSMMEQDGLGPIDSGCCTTVRRENGSELPLGAGLLGLVALLGFAWRRRAE